MVHSRERGSHFLRKPVPLGLIAGAFALVTEAINDVAVTGGAACGTARGNRPESDTAVHFSYIVFAKLIHIIFEITVLDLHRARAFEANRTSSALRSVSNELAIGGLERSAAGSCNGTAVDQLI